MSAEQLLALILSPIIAAVVSWALNRETRDQLKAQGKEIATLKDERVAKIERNFEIFQNGCVGKHERLNDTLAKVEHMAADVHNMVGWTSKLDGKLERISEATAGQAKEIDSHKVWLQNITETQRAHVGNREIHKP